MKHTLKSLLITTVLLPAVFGASSLPGLPEQHSGSTALTAAVTATTGDLESLFERIRVDEIITPQKKRIILNGLLPNATPDDIINAADALENLKEYTDYAPVLYKRFGNHKAATHFNFLFAADKLKKFRYFAAVADLYKKLEDRLNATFSQILWAANGLKQLGPEYYDDAAKLYKKAGNHLDATPDLILSAAYGLARLGYKYRSDAADLYKKVGNRKAIRPGLILSAAGGLQELGPEYYDAAAVLYKKVGNRKATRSEQILRAADGLQALGYNDDAAALYKKVGNHSAATAGEARRAADRLKQLGPKHYDDAAELYRNAAFHPNTSAYNRSYCVGKAIELELLKQAKALEKKHSSKLQGNSSEQ